MLIRERDINVDFVKFFAVLLIINSHADSMYAHLSSLATGGAIGDCLFLFCSGFTLLYGKNLKFSDYYKKRIARIFPSVFASIIFVHIIMKDPIMKLSELTGGEFVVAIMGYYVLLFFIKKYFLNSITYIIVLVAVLSLIIYVFWFPYKYETSVKGLYGITTYYRWIPYFAAMLIGAYMGKNKSQIKYNIRLDGLMLILCMLLFYALQFAAKIYRPIAPLQVVTLIPLMGIVVYMYKCCNNSLFRKIYHNKIGNFIVMFVGGLCLESYLIQNCLFTTKLNSIWPLNLIIIIIVIIVFAYLVRCSARFFLQSFRTDSYKWKDVFSFA